jgi:hypothetical protein
MTTQKPNRTLLTLTGFHTDLFNNYGMAEEYPVVCFCRESDLTCCVL